MRKVEMETMSEVLHHLKTRGEDNEVFIKTSGSLAMRSKCYNQNEITILKTYRFEGESDPADKGVIYLLKANDGTIGYSIDGYAYIAVTRMIYTVILLVKEGHYLLFIKKLVQPQASIQSKQ